MSVCVSQVQCEHGRLEVSLVSMAVSQSTSICEVATLFPPLTLGVSVTAQISALKTYKMFPLRAYEDVLNDTSNGGSVIVHDITNRTQLKE